MSIHRENLVSEQAATEQEMEIPLFRIDIDQQYDKKCTPVDTWFIAGEDTIGRNGELVGA